MRVLRFRGVAVEVQNYIDDTGVQVADVVVGFRIWQAKRWTRSVQIADTTRFDYLLLGSLLPRHRVVRGRTRSG